MKQMTFAKRFGRLLASGVDGCIVWIGTRSAEGYGRINIPQSNGKRTTRLAHIVAWEYANPDADRSNLNIVHLCNNKACVNIEHLMAKEVIRSKRDLNCDLTPKVFRYRYNKYLLLDPETHCWLWIGRKNKDGYGRIAITNRDGHRISTYIHILAFEAYNPTLNRGDNDVSHVCHHNNCCNPDHLVLLTHQQNMQMNTIRGIVQ